ncbi:MAG: ATPase, partial [Candidatus Micrarchaeia archaeon]
MNSSLNLTIRKQKAYLEQALSKSYVQRTGFAKAKKLVGTDLIKVVVGPRRAGKSVLSMLLL